MEYFFHTTWKQPQSLHCLTICICVKQNHSLICIKTLFLSCLLHLWWTIMIWFIRLKNWESRVLIFMVTSGEKATVQISSKGSMKSSEHRRIKQWEWSCFYSWERRCRSVWETCILDSEGKLRTIQVSSSSIFFLLDH